MGLGLTCVKANRDSGRPAIQKAQATDGKRKFLAIRFWTDEILGRRIVNCPKRLAFLIEATACP